MEKTVVIGGGIAGLLAAAVLESLGREFVGLEKGDQLGADLAVGHHRLYSLESAEYLSGLVKEFSWRQLDEPAAEWKKGKWVDVNADQLSEAQKYYLATPFLLPVRSYRETIQALIGTVGRHFQTRKMVETIDGGAKRVICADGAEYSFARVVWCQGLDGLSKAMEGASLPQVKGSKKLVEQGGLVLDMEFSAPVFERNNTVVLPYRYKDEILRAFGNRDNFEGIEQSYTWSLFLDDGLLENREEVAKVVRTFKRELFKQFPAAKDALKRERIVFLPLICGYSSLEAKSLRIQEGVYYVGSQVRPDDSEPNLQNLDRLIDNARRFGHLLAEESSGASNVRDALQPNA